MKMVAMVIMIVVIGWQYSHISHIHQLEYANFTHKSYSPTAFFTKIWLQHFCYKAMLVFLRWGPWSKRRENFIEIRKIKKTNKQSYNMSGMSGRQSVTYRYREFFFFGGIRTGIGKKSRNRYRKIWYRKKVLESVS